jgi:hypothetical protein
VFAESLKLPFPLLSDFADRKAIRSYPTTTVVHNGTS